MKILNIKNNWFSESDLRLDASYHLSEGRVTKLMINNCPYDIEPLQNVTNKIFNGARFKRYYVDNPEKGIPFMGSSDMLKTDLNGLKFISKKLSKNINSLKIEKDWILVSCSGTIGKTVFSNVDFHNKTASQHIMRIVANKKIQSGYLYAFLSSKYGYSLLTQGTYGAVIQHIEPNHIVDLPIPLIPDSKQIIIHNLIKEASNLQSEANNLLSEAENDFHSNNNISYLLNQIAQSENAIQTGFIVNKSELFTKTIKARNHSLRARQIIDIWNSKPGILFKDFVSEEGLTRGMGGFFKRVSGSNIIGLDIISQGDIHERKPIYKKVIKKNIKDSEIAKTGMVIIPSAGTLGENEIFLRPQLIYKNFEGKILSEVVGKIRPKNLIYAAYLFTALKSIGGFRILRTLVYGTNLMYPNWELMKNINIPCKDESTMIKIAEKVIEGYEKLALAAEKEINAIKLIETEIESWQKS
ncbi:methylation-associated defense system restriction endonuclease subunit S MAD5 [Flavobacterium facile]|uniref:methylation-associated defense system restriction endonuclease subunit S MAD5 n=1 Tax=Flavobacterium facile TaxID=2893174 RepID=UPI002E773613|nr:restriction endonuclease subunit S [Flavobacterium sp. T-12]